MTPRLRKSLRLDLRSSRHAGWGSTSSKPEASERQRRSATRRSWIASSPGDARTRARSLSTRSIQNKSPLDSAAFAGRGITAAMTTSTMPFRSLWVAPLRNGGEDSVVRRKWRVHTGWRSCGKALEKGYTPVFLCKSAQVVEEKGVSKSLLQKSEERVRKLLKTKGRKRALFCCAAKE